MNKTGNIVYVVEFDKEIAHIASLMKKVLFLSAKSFNTAYVFINTAIETIERVMKITNTIITISYIAPVFNRTAAALNHTVITIRNIATNIIHIAAIWITLLVSINHITIK